MNTKITSARDFQNIAQKRADGSSGRERLGNKISVRELCERADLNRSTFYAHYSEPKELLEEVENELLDATQDHLKKIGAETTSARTDICFHF